MPQETDVLGWPESQTIYLTLDLECDFGTALAENTYEALAAVDHLVEVLETYAVPLTVFVQTEVLDRRPEAVDRLRNSPVRTAFHPHSHTHRPRAETDPAREVERSTERFRSFFGAEPAGYRFPNGNLRDRDYRVLSELEYDFDASLFPSWRPGHFNNLGAPATPQYLPEYDLYELPFTVYSSLLPVPTALSYTRLLGRLYHFLLTRRPPPTVVFNVHMHDLVTPSTSARLPAPYRAIYARNDDGLSLLEGTIEELLRREYAFGILDDVAATVDTDRSVAHYR